MGERDFVDTLPRASDFDGMQGVEPPPLKDVARTFELLGVRTFRASIVETGTSLLKRQWAISDAGNVITSDSEVALDSRFPNAAPLVEQLAEGDTEKTLTQQLGPRTWRFAWRDDSGQNVVGEAEFHARRDAVIDMDIALLRLVGGMGVASAPHAGTVPAVSDVPLAASRIERRLRRREQSELSKPQGTAPVIASLEEPAASGKRQTWAALALLIFVCVLTGWLAIKAVPEAMQTIANQRQDLVRQRLMAQDTMVMELSTVMASGDYGHVQSVLSSFSNLGYFAGAVVANSRDRVIAMAGRTERLRIGDAPSAELLQTAVKARLKLGSQDYGQVLVVPVVPVPVNVSSFIEWMAWAAFAVSTLAAVIFALLQRKQGPSGV